MNILPGEVSRLFPELIEICSQFGNIPDTDSEGNISKDQKNLIEFYKTTLNNNMNWQQNNPDLVKNIIRDLSKICSSTTDSQFKNTVDNICQIMLNNLDSFEKNKAVDKTKDLINILQLAMGNSSATVCSNCIKQLCEEYGLEISVQDNKSISVIVRNSNDSEITKINKLISDVEGVIPLEIALIPQKNCNYQSLLKLAADYGQYVNKLDLWEMGNQISNENVKELTKFCGNINYLQIKSDLVTDLSCVSTLSNLTTLWLCLCTSLTELPKLSALTNLTTLNLAYCVSLKELPELSMLLNLTTLNLSNCASLKELSLSAFPNLTTLTLSGCVNLNKLSLSSLPNLATLDLSKSLKKLFLSALPKLVTLDLFYNSSLEELSLSALPNLATLDLSNYTSCTKLRRLSLSDLPSLATLNISCCEILKEVSLSSVTFLTKIGETSKNNYLKFLGNLNKLIIAEKEIKEVLADPIVKICIRLTEESRISLPWEFDSSEKKDLHLSRIGEILKDLKEIALKNSSLSEDSFDQFVKIFKDFEPQQYQKHVLWFGNIIAEVIDSPTLSADEEAISTLQSIAKLTDPFVIKATTSALFYLYQKRNEDKLHSWKSIVQETLPHLNIIKVAMAANGMREQEIARVVKLLKPGFFKSSEVIMPVNEFFLLLYKSTISKEQKERLIKMIFETPKSQDKNSKEKQRLLELNRAQQETKVIAARDILFFGAEQKLQEALSSDELISNWSGVFSDMFGIKGGEKEMQRFTEIFQTNARYPGGVVTYAARLQLLPEKKIFTDLLGKFIVAVLNGQYPDLRYKFDGNPHLENIFATRPKLLTKWRTPISLSAPQILGNNKTVTEDPIVRSKEIKKFIKEQLKTALEHSHLGKDQATIFPILSAFKEWNSPEDIIQAQTQLEKQHTEELRRIKSTNNTETKMLIQEKITQIEIQKNCFNLLNATLDEEQLDKLLDRIERVLPPLCEFKRDIVGIKKQIKTEKMPYDKWVVKDTDHWEDLLLIGSEVENSCLCINGVPYHNKCLISDLIDGKNRPMVVVDGQRKIIARAIMRILWDEKQNQPVLFMEKLYTKFVNPTLRELIMAGCKRKAEELNLTLVASLGDYPELTEKEGYTNPLTSYIGPAPAEYVDALRGIQNGRYTISGSRILYSPVTPNPPN